ncbi:MAG: PilZ domain-containing protein [Bacteriovoracaceae bacterium]|jgi:hypothetical protein|nr:PilZ domain-containing protein [Bacteriovoracaceae bacterium]
MEEMRTSTNSHEIISALSEVKNRKDIVTLWQKQEGKSRIICEFLLLKISRKEESLELIPIIPMEIKFSSKRPLFFFSEGRKIVFQIAFFTEKNGKTIFNIPSEVKISESRIETRQTLREGGFYLEFFKLDESTMGNYKCRLLDISDGGAGIYDKSGLSANFKKNDSIEISRICGKTLSPPLKARIAYIKEARIKKKQFSMTLHRIGVEFTRKIDLSQFNWLDY